MNKATYDAKDLHELMGLSTWAIYEAQKKGTFPVPAISVGRRLLWSKAAIDRLLDGGTVIGAGDEAVAP